MGRRCDHLGIQLREFPVHQPFGRLPAFAYLKGWWDADKSGTFDSTEEFIGRAFNPRQGIPSGPSAHPQWTSNSKTYTFPIPGGNPNLPAYKPQGEGDFFRFRLSYGGPAADLVGPTGSWAFGEVEDSFAIPEPVSLALLGFGVVALAQRRRKKK